MNDEIIRQKRKRTPSKSAERRIHNIENSIFDTGFTSMNRTLN